MVHNVRGSTFATAAAVGLAVLMLGVQAATAVCVGDCNDNGIVSAGELTKIISIINLCGGAAAGCAVIPGSDKQCTNADRDGNGTITAGDLTNVIANIIMFPNGCFAGLGRRSFSLGPASGFFSSLVPTLKAGAPAGTLKLDAGVPDAEGHTMVTLAKVPVFVQTNISLGGLSLCTKIESCSGTLNCNGGTNVDTIAQLDSLKSDLTCMRDGTNLCPDAAGNLCCSNACEGVGVGSGNQPARTGGVNPTVDSGAGSMLLMCQERIVSIPLPPPPAAPSDCALVDYSNAAETMELYTTGTSTAKVINFCAGTGAAANKAVTFFKTGQNFDCANWTHEDGVGVLAFSIPSEEGSDLFTGDGANAGLFSDAPAPTPTPSRTRTQPGVATPTPTPTPTMGTTAPPTLTKTNTPMQPVPTATPTATPSISPTSSGQTLGVRVFSIADKPKSDFFSSALEGLGVGATAPSFTTGPLKIVGGAKDANGVAPLSLQEDVVFGLKVVDTSVVCVKLIAAGSSGSIDCDGGTPYDVVATQDSNGDQPSSPNTLATGQGADGGAGAASLSVHFEAALLPVGSKTSDCPTANFNIILDSAFTTKKATATVLHALDGSPGADAAGTITLSKTGVNFTCATFATENSVGTLVAPFLGLDQSTGSQIIDTADVLQLADK